MKAFWNRGTLPESEREMANQNPDNPTYNVPLGGEQRPIAAPKGQPARAEGKALARATLEKVIKDIQKEEEAFQLVPGADEIDNAKGALQFCIVHLRGAQAHLKE